MKTKPAVISRWQDKFTGIIILAVVLVCLFWRSFLPQYVHFSNDGPLGAESVDYMMFPQIFTGTWDGLNLIGLDTGAASPNISMLLRWGLGALGYSKFYAPIALLILGMGAWTFFRALKFSQLAIILGTLAVTLSTGFFAGACWGVASGEIAVGFNFLALALITANTGETPFKIRILRLVLAGFCVGVNVMEASDIGALCSIFVATYVFFKSLIEPSGKIGRKIYNAIGRVAIIGIFAGLLATQTVISLVSTQIQGVSGMQQNAETKAAHWDWATQWSLPKRETLGIFVPGVFGYRMDTPNKLLPASLHDAYLGGVYWGGIGRSPEIDRFFASGQPGNPPEGLMRFGYAGYYCGILVVLGALWAIAQLFRRKNPIYSATQKKLVWFWTIVLIASLLVAWGRFAPMFYGALYQLPYFSTIRNPTKFLIFFQWAVAVLFAYAVDSFSRRYLTNVTVKNWDAFDRKLVFGGVGIFCISVIGWIFYAGHKPELIQYIQKVGYGDETFAQNIATFSINQAGWFVFLLAIAVILLALVAKGFFSGARAKIGALLLGAFLIFDLGRANLPYIIHWDYKQKYEVGSLNPVEEFLSQKPYEHRVAGLTEMPQQLRGYDNMFGGMGGIYRIEWTQHHFLYYNIQSLDIIQMPRMPEDIKAYMSAIGNEPAREWQLTNTRYLLAAAGFLEPLNQQLDPVQRRFRIVQRFDIVPKPGITQPEALEELTAVTNNDGDLALIEFTGALPRAQLFSNWQVNTNDEAVLKTLADPGFDPTKTVLVSTPQKDLPANSTNENSGSVDFKSYSPKEIVLAANASTPAVLLLNDRYDANWTVTVDGKPAPLLRCNFIMRGVYLPAGAHTVDFYFSLPNKPLFVTLAAVIVGIFLSGMLWWLTRKKN